MNCEKYKARRVVSSLVRKSRSRTEAAVAAVWAEGEGGMLSRKATSQIVLVSSTQPFTYAYYIQYTPVNHHQPVNTPQRIESKPNLPLNAGDDCQSDTYLFPLHTKGQLLRRYAIISSMLMGSVWESVWFRLVLPSTKGAPLAPTMQECIAPYKL